MLAYSQSTPKPTEVETRHLSSKPIHKSTRNHTQDFSALKGATKGGVRVCVCVHAHVCVCVSMCVFVYTHVRAFMCISLRPCRWKPLQGQGQRKCPGRRMASEGLQKKAEAGC